jgi:NodT family efflux transporter outer membrane factor (OMF) lipoprotein
MRRIVCAAVSSIAALLYGCALESPPKPDEIRAQSLSNLTAPASWTGAPTPPGALQDDWLKAFGDVQLDALVHEALLYNTDLLTAAARVEQAAAYAKLAGAQIYPALNVLAHGGGKMGGDGSGINGAGLFASWELDLWGRVRYERAAGERQYEAALLDEEYARQSIAATVAKSWMLAIQARLAHGIASDIVRSSEQSLGLAGQRLQVGRGDEYDVTLSQANLESVRDAERQLVLGQAQALRALETLVGRYPAAALSVPAALPAVPGATPAGVPSELLERRPDVVAAERRVAAAFNRVGEAKAARLPKISLSASVTSLSSSLFVLQNHSNPVASLGANLLAPIFSGFALEANVEIRNAEQKLAIADYGRIAQRAFGEVEAALSAAVTADEREVILARSVASNTRTLELANVRFNVGSGDLRAVLQQNVALYGARTALLQAQTDRLVQRINFYLALGGSFDPRAAPVAPVSSSADEAATLANASTSRAAEPSTRGQP